MNRRSFSKQLLAMGGAAHAGAAAQRDYYEEPAKKLPVRNVDVVVAGGGTGGVVAAIAAARQGAKTMLVEAKGYTGGTVVEGGTALHSYYNLWKAFPGVKKRQVVYGIPQQIVDRLAKVGAVSGHAEMSIGYDYDSVCTCIDTEMYKLVTMEMLEEAGVFTAVNTMVVGALRDGDQVTGCITECRSGREVISAKAFVDCTAYGDLCAHAGAKFFEPNDYAVCNSIGIGNVDIDAYRRFMESSGSLVQLAEGVRSGEKDKAVRVQAEGSKLPKGFREGARRIGMSSVTTTVHDNYFMFIKVNMRLPKSPTDRDTVAKAELELRRRQAKAVELFRQYVPGCKKAFIARTSPSLNIRRGRLIACDYDITLEDVLQARHFEDDIMAYGFHDEAPRYQIKNGGTYGIPYRALRVAGVDNLLAAGMMITSNHHAHMSTRNTVACMGQGQAAGAAAALCAGTGKSTRDLRYADLRRALEKAEVYFEG